MWARRVSLRSRVRSYFLESRWVDAKTGSLAREIADLETIVVDNEREALALENNLIKQYKPKFNVMLRDDKTYPYIKLTMGEKYPRVYFTRKVKKDGALYFGPYFPAGLARRIIHFIHKRFLVPSCFVDLTKTHVRPCLQFYIKRCLGPCVEGLTTDQRYAEAVRDVRMFLEGRRHDLMKSIEERMMAAAAQERFEEAASYRDLLRTMEDIEERQRIASAQGDDTDVIGYYARAAVGGRQCVSLARRAHRGPAGILLGDSGRFRTARICGFTAEAALPGGGIPAEEDSCAHRF